MKTYIFHGHACTHDLLVGSDWYVEDTRRHSSMYDSMIREILLDPSNCIVQFAQHPFVNPSETVLPMLIEELAGITITPTRYERYIVSTQLEEWEIIKSFNWANQHSTGATDTTQFVYKQHYTRVADVVSWSDFKRTIHALGCDTSADGADGFETDTVDWPLVPPR